MKLFLYTKRVTVMQLSSTLACWWLVKSQIPLR